MTANRFHFKGGFSSNGRNLDEPPERNWDFENTVSQDVQMLLDCESKIKEIKNSEIKLSSPILKLNDHPVIFPNTINLIQGQKGVHKSRLAEHVASVFLSADETTENAIGFTRKSELQDHTVVYIDTERNLHDQFPLVIQNILRNAGYKREFNPENFNYTSMVFLERTKRLEALNEYLQHLTTEKSGPLLVIIDVISDCVDDFNRSDSTLRLLDVMNFMINQHDVTFLTIVHENPGGAKARGHLGTELVNKSSMVMKIAFEKDIKQNDTDLISLRCLHNRNSKRFEPVYLKYSEDKGRLIQADDKAIATNVDGRRHKAPIEEVKDSLLKLLGKKGKMSRTELYEQLKSTHEAGDRTIDERLNEIMNSKHLIAGLVDGKQINKYLHKMKYGVETFYLLSSLKEYNEDAS